MQLLAKPTHAVWACVALSACATYRPTPLEPQRVLEALESIEWDSTPNTPNATDSSQSSPVVGPLQLAAFAVSTHPELAALRAELGIQHALLVEAGLLPDPELGWDAMDGLASQLVTGSSSSVDAWAGFGLLFPLLGPGERQASIAVAQGRSDEARYRIAEAEWNLTCDIHVALEEVLAAETLLAQTRSLTELATTTNEYFQRAKDAGAATAIQANLAQGDLQTIRLDGLRADARVRQARQALNALLGLPPSVDLPLGPGVDPSNLLTTRGTPEQLTLHAVDSRPDLAVLLAAYQASEEGVRLAMSQRCPRIAVGTGIRITLPIFSKFGGPA
ncbi:MAG TPA: TolC family protein, partial [Planctomycetota bacterium]|nr:TolC family protein [Planctomycetota bacterium]